MTREEAIKILEEGEVSQKSGFFEAYQMAIESLKQPEVIRCKDCKHWKYDARKLCGRCDALMCYRPDYFWCMYGERRTGNDDNS